MKPPQEVRLFDVRVYVNEREEATIKNYCKQHGTTFSKFVRECALAKIQEEQNKQ